MRKIIGILICMLMIGTCFVLNLDIVSADQEGDYWYTVHDGKATVNKYLGDGGAITIPSTLGGYPTVGIGYQAFWASENRDKITSITIPNSVITIEDFAFMSCKFTSITIPNSVTSIGVQAFSYCPLTSINIPDSVTVINDYAFLGCTSITTITIGSSVTTISISTFSGCSSLTSITFLGLVAPTTVGENWIKDAPAEIRGHAYSNSNFPAPGEDFHGLTIGEYIDEENELPVATFTWTPSKPTVNQQVTFDASTSSDTDGSITKYEWDWNNDGTYDDSKTNSTATDTWSQAGSYSVKLQVTDNDGATSTKTLTISVSSAGGNDDTDGGGTPGFELIILICAIALLLVWKRKRKF